MARDAAPVGRPSIRDATAHDVPALARLYADSVKALAPRSYSPEQVRAWASFGDDLDAFRRFILEPHTIVLEDDSGVLGFCGVEAGGHVASLYVRADRARQGIGTRLLQTAIDQAAASGMRSFHAQASELSLPVFKKLGFVVRDVERSVFAGIAFNRYVVRRAG